MAAVVEATLIEIRAEFRKAGAQLVGIDAPRADFAEAGRIDDVTDAGNRHELGGGGGVLPRAPFLADRADTQLEPRLEGIEQTRLPRARRACKDRVAAAQASRASAGRPSSAFTDVLVMIAGGLEARARISSIARSSSILLRTTAAGSPFASAITRKRSIILGLGSGSRAEVTTITDLRWPPPVVPAADPRRCCPAPPGAPARNGAADLGDGRSLEHDDVARDDAI